MFINKVLILLQAAGDIFLPFLIYGVLSISTGLLVLFSLPETRGRPLQQTIPEAEVFIKENRLCARYA